MTALAMNEFRLAFRGLTRRPGFAVLAVLTLALGIGANAAIFAVLHGLFLRPLPFPDGERLVEVHDSFPRLGWEWIGTSAPSYVERRAQARSLEDSALYALTNFNLAGNGATPQRVAALRATPSLFSTLRMQPLLGRSFDEAETLPGASKVVLIGQVLWQQHFNADPNIIGRELRLSDETFQVIGVMPAGFAFPDADIQLWVPLALTAADTADMMRGHIQYHSIARLRPEASLAQLQAELDAIIARSAQRLANDPDTAGYGQWLRESIGGQARFLREAQVGHLRPRLLLLQTAAVLLLMIACANVANVMLAQQLVRQRDLTLRSALGASRSRLVRQQLTEAGLIAILGGVSGVGMAQLLLTLLPKIGVTIASPYYAFRLDGAVLVFVSAMILGCVMLTSLLPIVGLARHDLASNSHAGPRALGSRHGSRWRSGLVMAQLAAATALLVGSALLLRSFQQLSQQSPGFEATGRLTAAVELPASRYGDAASRLAFFEQALERLRGMPGVRHAAFASALPFSGGSASGSYSIENHDAGADISPKGYRQVVSDEYFRTMGMPLLRGRAFDASDRAGAPLAVIVDQRMVDQYFKGRDPIGQRLRGQDGPDDTEWATIVGVVGTTKRSALGETPTQETLYWPLRQWPAWSGTLVLDTSVPPNTLIGPLREAIRAIDPEQPLGDIRMLDERIARSLDAQRAPMLLLSLFAGAALLLAAIGVYGVLAFSVSQRSGELGVRMAVGAGAGQIVALVMREGGRLIGVGLALGLIGAALGARALSAQLFGVDAHDPLLYAAGAGFLAVVAGLACYLPARRAAAIDPLRALRSE